MSKQTAVEWLVEVIQSGLGTGFAKVFEDEINQAKAMEREQIEHAWHDGHSPYGHMFIGNYLENKYGKEASNEEHS